MTQISEAYNAFVDKVEATIGKSSLLGVDGYYHAPDSIDPDQNPENILRKSFAVDFQASEKVQASVKTRLIQDRLFSVILTKEFGTTRPNAGALQSVKMDLLEDSETLRVAFLNDHTLSSKVVDVDWISDDGVPEYLGDKKKFFILTVFYAVRLDIRQ